MSDIRLIDWDAERIQKGTAEELRSIIENAGFHISDSEYADEDESEEDRSDRKLNREYYTLFQKLAQERLDETIKA
jgi:hypothetical protein